MKFYKCSVCGQIIAKVKETNSKVICCGKEMEEIIPGTVDASKEKHIPVYVVNDGKVVVTVGSIEHPMLDNHFIEWILLETKNGNQRIKLTPGSKPTATFYIAKDDEVKAVYAYCNLHGLWKA